MVSSESLSTVIHKELTPINNGELPEKEKANINIDDINEDNINTHLPKFINTTNGVGAKYLDTIIRYRAKHGGVEANLASLKRGEDALRDVESGRRLTTGILVSRGIHNLNDPRILERLTEKRDREFTNGQKKKKKVKREILKNINDVKNLRTEKPDIAKWNAKECTLYIRYKRIKSDTKNPTTIAALRARCVQFNKRKESPACSEADDSSSVEDDLSTSSAESLPLPVALDLVIEL